MPALSDSVRLTTCVYASTRTLDTNLKKFLAAPCLA